MPAAPAPLSLLTILLADDDVFHRRGVRLYLTRHGYQVVEAGDEATAWQAAQEHPPGAAIVDIALPATPHGLVSLERNLGFHLVARLKEWQPAMGVVLFSAYENHGREMLTLVNAGYRGLAYKLKGCSPGEVLKAIQDTLAGRVLIDPEVEFDQRSLSEALYERLSPEERPWVTRVVAQFDDLTPREREAALWLSAACTNDGIAQRAGISPKAAENLVSRVYQKLGLDEMARVPPGLRQAIVLTKACMLVDLREGSQP
jgi:DNA-binding NarL/FixJ family response regulator